MEYINGGLYIDYNTLSGVLRFLVPASLEILILHASLIKTVLAAFIASISLGTAAIISGLIAFSDPKGLAIFLFSAFYNKLGINNKVGNYFGFTFIPKLKWEVK